MSIDFLKEAEAIAETLIHLREQLHRCPEPGNREYQTAKQVENFLRDCEVDTVRVLDTGIIGILRGSLPGKTTVLRADLDALPITERTGVSYASENAEYMHACGHDVHIASALGAAKILSRYKKHLMGTVLFVFQPDEEGSGGAQRMLQTGLLENADCFFGCHVDPDLPLGTVGIRYGKFYAASDMFEVRVSGTSAHGAEPEKGNDALCCASEMICALKQMMHNSQDPCIIHIGTIQAGTAGNIVADSAVFSGILRTLGSDARSKLKKSVRSILCAISERFKTRFDLHITESYPGITNSEFATRIAQSTATDLFGSGMVLLDKPTMKTEDFGYYIDASCGSFYHIGAGCTKPLHNPEFLPDPQSVIVATAMHSAVLFNSLQAIK